MSANSNVSLSDLYFILDDKWKRILKDWMQRTRVCLKCRDEYKEIDNLGKWACKQHTGPWNDNEAGEHYGKNVYDCCGNKRRVGAKGDPSGCVRADHTELASPYTEYHDVPLPTALVNSIVLYQESLVNSNDPREVNHLKADDSSEAYVIRRFDWKESDRRKETGTSIYC